MQAIFAPITKRTLKVTPQNAAAEVPPTVALTMQGRPGPVHLQVSNEEAELQAVDPRARPGLLSADGRPQTAGEVPPRPHLVANARRLIAAAARPVILAGLGLEPEAPYDALRSLAEAANAPVIVSPKAKGALPDDHPLSAGVIGLTRADPAYEILDEADCIVAVGLRCRGVVRPWSSPHFESNAAGEGTGNVPLIWIANWPNEDPVLPAAVEIVGPDRGGAAATCEQRVLHRRQVGRRQGRAGSARSERPNLCRRPGAGISCHSSSWTDARPPAAGSNACGGRGQPQDLQQSGVAHLASQSLRAVEWPVLYGFRLAGGDRHSIGAARWGRWPA